MKHPVIMGRKTYDSIGKPLPGRTNIILSRSTSRSFPGCVLVNTLEEACSTCAGEKKAFIIGGGEIFRQCMHIIDTIIITQLERDVEGDIPLPLIDPAVFKESEKMYYDEEEPYQIITYRRT